MASDSAELDDSSPIDRVDFDTPVSRLGTDSLKWDRYKGQDILPFWVADMDFPVAKEIQRALETRVRHGVFGYSLPPAALAPTITAHLQREFGWHIEPEWLIFLPGVVAGLAVGCRAFVRPGEDILINTPIYHHFFDSHIEGVQRAPIRVPLWQQASGRWTVDIERLEATFHEGVGLLMLCSPHNPGGTVFTADELDRVVRIAARHDAIVLSDEIHADIVLDPRCRHVPTAVACPGESERIVTLMSASKAWNIAGLNCSFAISPNAELRERWKLASRSIVPGVPPLAYTATLAAYGEGDPWRRQLLDYLRGNYALIEKAIGELDGLRLDPLQATFLAWIDATALDLDFARQTFETFGLGFDDGEKFGKPGYLRWNFACPRSLIEEGIRRLGHAMDAIARR